MSSRTSRKNLKDRRCGNMDKCIETLDKGNCYPCPSCKR